MTSTTLPAVAREMVVTATRCWRLARDRGEPVMPCLYAALEDRHGSSLLVPTFNGLICAYEASLGRRLATGSGAALSGDESCLLDLIDPPVPGEPGLSRCNAAALATRDCAACSARIMLRLVLGGAERVAAAERLG